LTDRSSNSADALERILWRVVTPGTRLRTVSRVGIRKSPGRGFGLRLVVAAALALSAAGCSGDKAQRAATTDAQVTEFQKHLGALGARKTILSQDDANHLRDGVLGRLGLDAAERQCVAAAVRAVLLPDGAIGVSVDRIGKMLGRIKRTDNELGKQVTTCLSPEGKVRFEATTAAPDAPVDGLLDVGRRVSMGESRALGATDTEATCIADASLRGITAVDLASALVGKAPEGIANSKDAIRQCVSTERLTALNAAAQKATDDYQRCVDERNQQALAEAQRRIASSIPAPTGPTTTVVPCL
jgi:hypothetical protein